MPINYKQLDEFQTKEITQDMVYIYFEYRALKKVHLSSFTERSYDASYVAFIMVAIAAADSTERCSIMFREPKKDLQ